MPRKDQDQWMSALTGMERETIRKLKLQAAMHPMLRMEIDNLLEILKKYANPNE